MKKFVICDEEEMYAKRLAELFACKKELVFEVYSFSAFEQVLEFEKENEIELLLVNEHCFSPEQMQIHIPNVFLLCEERGKDARKIYKYQSAEEIFRVLAEICIDEGKDYFRKWGHGQCKMVGIYSPIGRCGKTQFSMKLGRELAKKNAVLYLNLNIYEGNFFINAEERAKTLTDVLYYSGLEDGKFGIRFGTLVRRYGNLDYVLPCRISLDLKAVSEAEWRKLFEQLWSEGLYEIILLEAGECIQGFYEVLETCGKIYMPVRKEAEAMAKVDAFEKELAMTGREGMLTKIQKVDPEEEVSNLLEDFMVQGGME